MMLRLPGCRPFLSRPRLPKLPASYYPLDHCRCFTSSLKRVLSSEAETKCRSRSYSGFGYLFHRAALGSVKSRVSISRQPRRGLPRKAKHQAKLYNTATYRRSERAAVILHPLLLVVTWNIKFKKASDLPYEVAAQICQVFF